VIFTIAITIVVLGVLIFVHELGHFAAAKSVDIEVPRFSIGLGPKMIGFRRGETEYVLSWIPLGGYVKMAGMAEEEVTSTLEGGGEGDSETEGGEREEMSAGSSPRDFDSKPLWARVFVISAGVLMNWLFAIVAFTAIALSQGIAEPRISSVGDGSRAELAGLQEGDLIRRIDGTRVRDATQVIIGIERKPGEPIEIVVERAGELVTTTATPESVEEFNEVLGQNRIVGRVGIGIDTQVGQVGFGGALAQGLGNTAYWSTTIVQFLGDLFTGRSSAREVGGPLMIGEISGRAARAGFWPLLGFMAIISINLAVFNLLPIPVLDGGHLLFLGIEGIRGKALSLDQRLRFTTVGMVFVVGLMLWAVGNDLVRVLFR